MAVAIAMHHDNDPAAEIKANVGDVSSVEVFHNLVLVGTYIRPEKTKSGLFLGDQARDEDKWQGKVGLVLKVGPLAFVDDDRINFAGVSIKDYDWVMFRPSDGFQLTVNGHHCRLLEDSHIKGRIEAPDVLW